MRWLHHGKLRHGLCWRAKEVQRGSWKRIGSLMLGTFSFSLALLLRGSP